MKSYRPIVVLAMFMLLLFGSLSLTSAQEMDFSGITLDVVTFTGPQIAEPLQRRGAEFAELTGVEVNVVTVPFSDGYIRESILH
ncbi:MAG: hypothetical protein Q9P01_13630 [Anaerolineae bacterium]|nr:hypothetical protein [Anaerolineae bacterium]